MRGLLILLGSFGLLGCVSFPQAHLVIGATLREQVAAPVVCGPVGFRKVPLQSRWGEYVRVTVAAPVLLRGSVFVNANGVAQEAQAWSTDTNGSLVIESRFENLDPDSRFALLRERPIDITITGLETPAGGSCEGAVFTVEQGALVPSIGEGAWVAELERRGGPELAARREAARTEAEARRQAHYAQWEQRQVVVAAEVVAQAELIRQGHYAQWEAHRHPQVEATVSAEVVAELAPAEVSGGVEGAMVGGAVASGDATCGGGDCGGVAGPMNGATCSGGSCGGLVGGAGPMNGATCSGGACGGVVGSAGPMGATCSNGACGDGSGPMGGASCGSGACGGVGGVASMGGATCSSGTCGGIVAVVSSETNFSNASAAGAACSAVIGPTCVTCGGSGGSVAVVAVSSARTRVASCGAVSRAASVTVSSSPSEWSRPPDAQLRPDVEWAQPPAAQREAQTEWGQPYGPRLEPVVVSTESQVAMGQQSDAQVVVAPAPPPPTCSDCAAEAAFSIAIPALFQVLLNAGPLVVPAPAPAPQPEGHGAVPAPR